MKDKEIKIRADEDFIEKVDYLQRINGHKNRSETIRKTVEKEYKKETDYDFRFYDFLLNHMNPNQVEMFRSMFESKGIAVEGKEKEK